MSIEKKSLINNMTATKRALIASNTTPSPVVSSKIASKPSVGLSKPSPVGLSKKFSKPSPVGLSKKFSKPNPVGLSKKLSKPSPVGLSKRFE